VRPNSEVIPSEHSISVKILSTYPISQESEKFVNDRFLVQLSKLDTFPGNQLTSDEIGNLWDQVDKSKLIQYKLKVDLGQEVTNLISSLKGSQVAGSATQSQSERQSDIYKSVQN